MHGGNGFIEENPMARLYREAPLNAIWEGTTNMMCMDVLRALSREKGSLEVFMDEVSARGTANSAHANFLSSLRTDLGTGAVEEGNARAVVTRMALALQASEMLKHSAGAVAQRFIEIAPGRPARRSDRHAGRRRGSARHRRPRRRDCGLRRSTCTGRGLRSTCSERLVAVRSVQAAVSAEERQTRVDLAACYRLISAYGMSDLIYNHISARIPGQGEHYLINPYGMLYDEITASSLVKIDVEGHTLLQPDHGYSVNVAGFYLHAPIHKTRPDVQCIIHTHARAGTAVSGLKEGLLPCRRPRCVSTAGSPITTSRGPRSAVQSAVAS